MTKRKNTTNATVDPAKQLIAGAANHLAGTTHAILEGSTYTPTGITP
jgi:hypothetical protein